MTVIFRFISGTIKTFRHMSRRVRVSKSEFNPRFVFSNRFLFHFISALFLLDVGGIM